MILIADSGSTKCDWVLLKESGIVAFKERTLGLNPDILSVSEIKKRIEDSKKIFPISQKVREIHFFGAGCGSDKSQRKLENILSTYFKNATCKVRGDLEAARLAVTDKPGIICILGTGSNSLYFDGKDLLLLSPSLGYSIMDEGSGNYLGKRLLQDYFYKKMPKSIAKAFENEFNLDPNFIKGNLYKKPNPNAYLADFAQFIFKFNPIPGYLHHIIKTGLELFVERWVINYPKVHTIPVHFVGSIAYYSADIIKEVLEENRLLLGKIERRPIEGVTQFFQNQLRAKANR